MNPIQNRQVAEQFFNEVFPQYYGFVLSRAIYVVTKMHIAEALETGTKSAAQLCMNKDGLQIQALERVLNLLVSHGIFSKSNEGAYSHNATSYDLKQSLAGKRIIAHHDRFWNRLQTADKTAFDALAEPNEASLYPVEKMARLYFESRALYLAVAKGELDKLHPVFENKLCQAFILHDTPERWLALGRLEEAICSNVVPFEAITGKTLFGYLANKPELGKIFSDAMTFISEYECQRLVPHLQEELRPGMTLIDVGGGRGRYLQAVLEAYPEIFGVLFDIQENIAQHALEGEPLKRATCVAGSFFEELPEGDVYLFKRVLHDWSDAECVQILQKVAKAAKPGAKLILNEFLLPGVEAEIIDVYFMTFLKGQQRSIADFTRILALSGWQLQKASTTDCWLGQIVALKL